MITQDQVPDLVGMAVYDVDGEKVGKVGQVYLEDDSKEPSWVTVRTGFFGIKESFAPLNRARIEGEHLVLSVKKEAVKGAPRIDADGELPANQEVELYGYYDINPARHPANSDPAQERLREDEPMIRSEERVRMDVESGGHGGARLRKYVVTEKVETTSSSEKRNTERRKISGKGRKDRADFDQAGGSGQ